MNPWDIVQIVGTAADFVGKAKDFADQFGQVVDEVTVTVYGTPQAKKKDLFKVAAATAFSLVHRLAPGLGGLIPAPGSITVQYDAADKYLTFHLKYSNTLAVALTALNAPNFVNIGSWLIGGAGAPAGLVDAGILRAAVAARMPVLSGPYDEVRGGKWTFTGPGLGDGKAGGFPTPDLTRWEGKIILTDKNTSTPPIDGPGGIPVDGDTSPTINPRPLVDHRSRGSFANLVFTALSTAGSSVDMTYPATTGTVKDFIGG